MHQLLALVGRYWPFSHGTGWLVERPSRLIQSWPNNQLIRLKDGRVFEGNLNDRVFRDLYLYGTYEPIVTAAIGRLIRPDDVVIDVGANIGVITALMGRLVGNSGHVLAFEPVPTLFEVLKNTVALNELDAIVSTHLVVVSDGSEDQIVIYVPNRHSHACSSVKVDDPSTAIAFTCAAVALEAFYVSPVLPSLIKVDVEGAEMSVLRGSRSWCLANRAPIWVLEANYRAAKRFGYAPEDLATFLAESGYHHFFWSDDHRVLPFEIGSSFPADGTIYALPRWAVDDGRIPTTRYSA